MNTSVVPDTEDSGDSRGAHKNGQVVQNGKTKPLKVKRNETREEKVARRKLERKKRTLFKKQAKGELVPTKTTPKKVVNLINQIWDRESKYVAQVMECLPEVRQPGLLIDEEERAEDYISTVKRGKELGDDEREKEKARERIRKNLKREGVELIGERAKSYQELKERLQQKLAGKGLL